MQPVSLLCPWARQGNDPISLIPSPRPLEALPSPLKPRGADPSEAIEFRTRRVGPIRRPIRHWLRFECRGEPTAGTFGTSGRILAPKLMKGPFMSLPVILPPQSGSMILCGQSACVTLPHGFVHQEPSAFAPFQNWKSSVGLQGQFPRGFSASASSAALVTPFRTHVETGAVLAQALGAAASPHEEGEAGPSEGLTGSDADTARLRQEAAEALKLLSPAEMKALRAHAHRLGEGPCHAAGMAPGLLFAAGYDTYTLCRMWPLATTHTKCVSCPASEGRFFADTVLFQ